ncbi:hypothetical protein A176_005369 [Myxococcus hansupus]|uniref:Uncharacterized protein n=1 Tax=Pseudomyxococcus hansupus TaxID=1297742 RepID=A0A0H4XJN6_9BACT|nr:hypothetical protein A176_005369 [Myxococcus hansupus]
MTAGVRPYRVRGGHPRCLAGKHTSARAVSHARRARRGTPRMNQDRYPRVAAAEAGRLMGWRCARLKHTSRAIPAHSERRRQRQGVVSWDDGAGCLCAGWRSVREQEQAWRTSARGSKGRMFQMMAARCACTGWSSSREPP